MNINRGDILKGLSLVHSDTTRTDAHPDAQLGRLEPPQPLAAVAPVTDYRSALRSIANRPFCRSEKYGQQQWRANRRDCNSDIIEFERVFIKRMLSLDVPMFAHEMMRSAADQNAAYVRGVSKAKAGESAHNFGAAVDIIHGTKAWDLTAKSWEVVGHVGKEICRQRGFKISWGGDWKFWDPAHWEITDWKARYL